MRSVGSYQSVVRAIYILFVVLSSCLYHWSYVNVAGYRFFGGETLNLIFFVLYLWKLECIVIKLVGLLDCGWFCFVVFLYVVCDYCVVILVGYELIFRFIKSIIIIIIYIRILYNVIFWRKIEYYELNYKIGSYCQFREKEDVCSLLFSYLYRRICEHWNVV